MASVKRALSTSQFLNTKFNVMHFEGEWLQAVGEPEMSGSWIIYGPPKNGKTRFALMLCKYLTNFTRVAYDSLEEGYSESLQKAFLETGIYEVGRRVLPLDKESIEDLKVRLRKPKSPGVVFIDSLKYSGLKYAEYTRLKDEFRNKLFIFISHSDGKQPKGDVAQSIQYDANIVIKVEGYKAFPTSRYGGGQSITVWEEGASAFW